MKALFLSIIFTSVSISECLYGQEVTLKGKITSETNVPIADALVLIFANDSILLKTEISTETGEFQFNVKDQQSYFIKITSDESKEYYSALIAINGETILPTILLKSSKTELDVVEVTVKKPYLERQPGKLILNIENSINATGSSAFELLEKAPGVSINSNDNISLSGKQGIIIQIDGKTTPMSGTDLANYLRGIPSNAIEKIELISNPSSKYDAAGNAIINIKLKKDTRLGTNGSATLSYGQGVYPKTNEGLNLNHRTKKINVYGSYNFSYRKAFNHLVLERRFYENDTFQGAYLQDNYIKFPFKNHIARVGVDITLNPKNSIGVVVSGVSNQFNPDGRNVSDVLGPNGLAASSFETSNNSKDKWYNGATNINFKHVLDTLGSEWTIDFDIAKYGNTTEQLFTTRYFNLAHQESQSPYILYGDIHGDLSIYSLKTDVHKEFKSGVSVEYGLKGSYVIADNNLAFFDRSNGVDQYDSTKSNHFIYRENINAGYFNVTQRKGKWNYQLGLRAEYTHVTGEQLVYNITNDTSYLQLFPTVFLGYTINAKNTIELSYNRRIDRPGYDQLNPFKFYLDPSTYKEGNPYLRPQTTHTIELAHLWKEQIYTQLGIARTLDNITEVIAPLGNQANITVQTNTNLRKVDLVYSNISAPIQVTDWWNSTTNFNGYVALYSGNMANTTISNRGGFAYSIASTNTFTFGKTWSFEVSGNYRSKEIYAFDNIKHIWFASAGIQKKIMKGNGTVKLNVSDLFFTNGIQANVRFTDYTEYFNVKRETRVATVSFTYKFGKSSVPQSKRRNGGAEDLKNRVGGARG